jgi:hypothetical protein
MKRPRVAEPPSEAEQKRLAEEIERRKDAARRLPPLPDGRRDPMLGQPSDGRES